MEAGIVTLCAAGNRLVSPSKPSNRETARWHLDQRGDRDLDPKTISPTGIQAAYRVAATPGPGDVLGGEHQDCGQGEQFRDGPSRLQRR